MEILTDLKAILHSKRANIYFIEKCRVMVKNGRVVYLTESKNEKNYWNIPIANTTVILLGIGTSITQLAVKLLASAGVLIGFCGSGGTPLITANEVEWLSPQSEYRPTEYIQGWLSFWFDDTKRLSAAKRFQQARLAFIKHVWNSDSDLKSEGFCTDDFVISAALETFNKKILSSSSVGDLLLVEAQFTKALYKIAAKLTSYSDFTRKYDSEDEANQFLNHGNYLTYGLAATTLWVLGIPHGFAVMHGKTRRGALVFDVADLIKDALILPWSFVSAKNQVSDQQFRQQCIQNFIKHKALDTMFDFVKALSRDGDKL
jgi:CRISPR-associated protein Cas1